MAQSSALRLSDLRLVHTLVGECRELGDDQPTWRLHLARQLGALVGAALCQTGDGYINPTGGADGGLFHFWVAGELDPAAVQAMVDGLRRSATWNPMVVPYFAVQDRDDGAARTRPELVPDSEWYRSDYFEVHRALGIDSTLFCNWRLPGGRHTNLIFARSPGERDFSARQKAVVSEFHALIAPLISGPLAGHAEPSPAVLAPRERQVLMCLLRGDSEKQAGLRLGLTRNTVNQYAKRIYRHFGVTSRAELMARWLKRGWGATCAWADEVR